LARRKTINLIDPARPGLTDARDRLLTAASELMRERDVIDVSIRDVGERAGLNSALVRYYFGNKDGIRFAVFQHDVAESLARQRVNQERAASPTDKLKTYIREVAWYNSRYPSGQRLAMSIIRDLNESNINEAVNITVGPLMIYLRAIVTAGIDAGEFAPIEPEYLFFIIIGACAYIFSTQPAWEFFFDEALSPEDIFERHVHWVTTVVLGGMGVKSLE
jgi:TetR/AcrR family transcriptional regulator